MPENLMEGAEHVPVLAAEVLEYLDAKEGQTIIDATVGFGGHSALIAPLLGATGHLICIDQDGLALERARSRIAGCKTNWAHGNFANVAEILRRLGIEKVDGILADLGVSSAQLDLPERGFSFRSEGPLDMRMDPTSGHPASRLVDRLSAEELADIFWQFGEERFSRRIAARIVERRREKPIETTTDLADIVRSAIGFRAKNRGDRRKPQIDPATRVFQALRIAVNDELGVLDDLLHALPAIVKPGGRAVLISFHSLEDRKVKYAFREQDYWRILTKKPVTATESEMAVNPRSRSAKLRAAERNDQAGWGAG